MMRCAGCGQVVSEYAARCPGCQSGLGGAEYVDENPRPAASDHRRALLISAVVAAVALLICVPLLVNGGATASSGETPLTLPAAIHALPGKVLALAADGRLSLSQPDGRHRTSVAAGAFGGIVAPQGDLGVGDLPQGADPLSDHGRAVVVGTGPEGPGYTRAIYMVRTSDRQTTSLGLANTAAADPATVGAFVALAAPRQAADIPSGGIPALADSLVELRDVGRLPVVLASAGELNRDVHQPAAVPVNLGLFPSPDGSEVAVTLNPLAGSQTALVILDRHGHLLGEVGPGSGPAEYTQVYWSPDDRSLSYATFDAGAPAFGVLDSARSLYLQELQPGTTIGGCAWSPDSRWVVCQATGGLMDNWVLARNDPGLTPIYSFRAQGRPVAWLS